MFYLPMFIKYMYTCIALQEVSGVTDASLQDMQKRIVEMIARNKEAYNLNSQVLPLQVPLFYYIKDGRKVHHFDRIFFYSQ